MSRIRIIRNIKLLPVFNFFRCFVLFNLIQVLYIHEVAGSYVFAMGMMTLMSLFNALLDIPTGILSDKIGRKMTLILSSVSYMFTTVLYVMASFCYPHLCFILGSFFYGLALSLYSGTLTAIAYETMSQLKIKRKYPDFIGKCSSTTQLGHATAALLAGYLSYKIGYMYTVALTLIPQIISLLISLFIVEAEYGNYIKEHKIDIRNVLRKFRENKKLMLICITKSITVGSKNSSHRFEPVYFKLLISIQFIGFLRFLKQSCGFFSYLFSGRIINKLGEGRTLFLSVWSIEMLKIAGLIMNNFVTPFLYSITNLFHGSMLTSFVSLEQNEFTDEERATMGSIISLFSNLFTALFTLLAGYIADIYGLRAAIIAVLVPALIVLPMYNLFVNVRGKFALWFVKK